MARWCLLRTSWLRLGGGARWFNATVGGRGPSRLRFMWRVCSANSVWMFDRSRVHTHRPFSTRISSPGRKPGNTHAHASEKPHGSHMILIIIDDFRVICAIFKEAGTFVESQSIRKHFTDKDPAVFLAVYVSSYCKTWQRKRNKDADMQ